MILSFYLNQRAPHAIKPDIPQALFDLKGKFLSRVIQLIQPFSSYVLFTIGKSCQSSSIQRVTLLHGHWANAAVKPVQLTFMLGLQRPWIKIFIETEDATYPLSALPIYLLGIADYRFAYAQLNT